MNSISLRGRVVIVTGASSGIGAATAREFSTRGARVVLAARRTSELEAIRRAIESAGGTALAVATDVAEADQVARLVEVTVGAWGSVDVLVNIAGVNWRKPLVGTSAADIARVVNTNLLGAMLLTRAVLPGMVARRRGAIISVGSLSGRVAMEPVYSATKYGLRGFSLALRRQLAGTGVSVSLVSPGNIRTPMTAHVSGRLPAPELVATAIASLALRPRREVVLPRKHYAIAWLEQLWPSMADQAYRLRNWSPVE